MEITQENIIELSKRAISDELVGIVKVVLSGPPSNRLVSLEIWHPDVVDLAMCEKVSAEINQLLDEEDPFEDSYTLEIASLPLTRKLESFDDFRRAVNENIKIKFRDKSTDDIQGLLKDTTAENLVFEINSSEKQIPLSEVRSGKIIF